MDPDTFYPDDFSWLDEATKLSPYQLPVQFELLERLLAYRARTFHACRPRSLRPYLKRGLRKLRLGESTRQLRRLVARHERLAPLRDEAVFQAALATLAGERRPGKVYVELDDRPLVGDSGHYLIYGSEYCSAVLVQAGDCWFQDVLKTEGIPTVLVIDLPLKLASASDLVAFSNFLLSEWAKGVVRRQRRAPWEDFSFSLTVDVPPECISGHYHPDKIRDPLHHFQIYRSPVTTCPECRPNGDSPRYKR